MHLDYTDKHWKAWSRSHSSARLAKLGQRLSIPWLSKHSWYPLVPAFSREIITSQRSFSLSYSVTTPWIRSIGWLWKHVVETAIESFFQFFAFFPSRSLKTTNHHSPSGHSRPCRHQSSDRRSQPLSKTPIGAAGEWQAYGRSWWMHSVRCLNLSLYHLYLPLLHTSSLCSWSTSSPVFKGASSFSSLPQVGYGSVHLRHKLQTQTLPDSQASLWTEKKRSCCYCCCCLNGHWMTLVDRFQTRISHHPRSVAHQLGQWNQKKTNKYDQLLVL